MIMNALSAPTAVTAAGRDFNMVHPISKPGFGLSSAASACPEMLAAQGLESAIELGSVQWDLEQ
jgi:hypothetical protein